MTRDISARFQPTVFWGWLGRSWSSLPDVVRVGLLIAGAVTVGLVAWSGEPRLLPAAMMFPLLWGVSPTRICATLVAAGYFLAASRGLPQGVANFYGSGFAAGVALWLGASVLFVAIHTLAWTARQGSSRVIRYAIVAILMTVPPIGIVGWAHPVTAAGILFPGWGWLGLVLAVSVLLAMTSRNWPMAVAVLSAIWLWSALSWTATTEPQAWVGIDTRFDGSIGKYAGYQQHLKTIDRVSQQAKARASVVVLPESALGIWTPTIERFWLRAIRDLDVTVYGGAVIVNETGYDNVMLELSKWGASVRYRERMPVPVSMWQPWRSLFGAPAGARANFFANPVVSVQGLRVATLICYEQLLVWPVLESALEKPDVLVAPANGWWSSGTDIVAIQMAATVAWARLFDLHLVTAINT